MPTLTRLPEGGFSFQGVIQFERLDSMGSLSANLVFCFEDGYSLGMHLPRGDLVAIHKALTDWLGKEPSAKDEPQSKH
jgi:hypothetical protein